VIVTRSAARTPTEFSTQVGVCWDNALAESWFGGFENELVHLIGAFPISHEAVVEIAPRQFCCTTPTAVTRRSRFSFHTPGNSHNRTRAAWFRGVRSRG